MEEVKADPIFSATRIFLRLPSARVRTATPTTVDGPVHPRSMTSWQAMEWCYQWLLWSVLVGLLLSQMSCIFWDSASRYESRSVGEAPSIGLHGLSAEAIDPEPFADRVIACVLDGGRQYLPMTVASALTRKQFTETEDANMINGYRIVRRTLASKVQDLSVEATHRYTSTCDSIAWTMDAMVSSCSALGYNATDDYLRVVDGIDSSALRLGIIDSLPVLIEPLADDELTARYILPGYDGAACVVRLLGRYETPTSTAASPILRGVHRTIRDRVVHDLLASSTRRKVEGVWRNGWFETNNGSKWHADIISTASVEKNASMNGTVSQIFDTELNVELPATSSTQWPIASSWGSVITGSNTLLWFHATTLSNGERFGIQSIESAHILVMQSAYDLETLLVNFSIGWVLARWAVCMVATHRAFKQGLVHKWEPMSLGGAVACMHHFQLMPLVLLVRIKRTLATFWTVGCLFAGEQRAVSEAWFVVYPAIVELLLLQYSILNVVAKVLRRRVTDACFGLSAAVLCVMHMVRELTFVKPVQTLISSSELDGMDTFQVLLHARRINGNVDWVLYLKVAVLAVNWLLLFVYARPNVTIHRQSLVTTGCRVEKAMALRMSNLGGLGMATVYWTEDVVDPKKKSASRTAITAYEFVRLGYVVIGGAYAVSIRDWSTLLLLYPWRRCVHPPLFRVTVFTLESSHGATSRSIAMRPEMMRINDPRLQRIDLSDISTASLH